MLSILLAVVPVTDRAGAMAEDADACGASGMQRFVGGPQTALQRLKLAQPVLVMRPGEQGPAQANHIRLLVHVDAAGIVISLACG